MIGLLKTSSPGSTILPTLLHYPSISSTLIRTTQPHIPTKFRLHSQNNGSNNNGLPPGRNYNGGGGDNWEDDEVRYERPIFKPSGWVDLPLDIIPSATVVFVEFAAAICAWAMVRECLEQILALTALVVVAAVESTIIATAALAAAGAATALVFILCFTLV